MNFNAAKTQNAQSGRKKLFLPIAGRKIEIAWRGNEKREEPGVSASISASAKRSGRTGDMTTLELLLFSMAAVALLYLVLKAMETEPNYDFGDYEHQPH